MESLLNISYTLILKYSDLILKLCWSLILILNLLKIIRSWIIYFQIYWAITIWTIFCINAVIYWNYTLLWYLNLNNLRVFNNILLVLFLIFIIVNIYLNLFLVTIISNLLLLLYVIILLLLFIYDNNLSRFFTISELVIFLFTLIIIFLFDWFT